MAEVHYLISDASKQVDVESHVLRYWEDELELDIPRNEMGHRYYTEYHIRLFRQIKDLKEKGYQLKAIKNALNKMAGVMEEITITEDYMEEDMKAAWNEGPAREQPKARLVEGTRERTGEKAKNRLDEKAGGQPRVRAAEGTGVQSRVRITEGTGVQPRVRTVEGAGVQPRVRTAEEGETQPRVRLAQGGKADPDIQAAEKGDRPLPAQTSEKKAKEPVEMADKQPGKIPIHLAEGSQPAASSENLRKNVRKTEETSLRQLESAPPKDQTIEINAEKMARFQSVMNHIIGRAMDANMDRLAREVSNTVSEDVTDKVMKEVEYLMRVTDEKEEERFRQLDETIRAYQKQQKGRAEAAATKIPFFKKKKFGKSGKKMF